MDLNVVPGGSPQADTKATGSSILFYIGLGARSRAPQGLRPSPVGASLPCSPSPVAVICCRIRLVLCQHVVSRVEYLELPAFLYPIALRANPATVPALIYRITDSSKR